MAKPQAENGHTDVANEIVEAFQKLHLTGNQWQLLWVILRQTYGWHKKIDKISQTYFAKQTGIARRNVGNLLNKLLKRNIITKNDDTYIVSYGLQKDYTKWKYTETVIENNDSKKLSLKTMTPIIKNNDGTVIKNNAHKRKKENKQKKRKILFDGQENKFINLNGHLKIFKEKFTNINIEAELRKMEAWLYANPKKRKSNYENFIVNWLSRVQSAETGQLEKLDQVVL